MIRSYAAKARHYSIHVLACSTRWHPPRSSDLTTCAGPTTDLWELSSGRYDLLLLLNRLVLRLQVSGVDCWKFAQHVRYVERYVVVLGFLLW